MRKLLYLFSGLFMIVSFACDGDKTMQPPDGEITFEDDIQPLLKSNCVSCHTAGNASGGLNLDSWATVNAGAEQGEVVIPFDPENSLLIEMLTKLAGGAHPGELAADTLSSQDVATISTWILEGAKDDAGNIPFENAANLLYVCNQNSASVSVIDTDANLVMRNVNLLDFGHTPTSKPHHIAVESDDTAWYVSLIEESKILKFNRNNEKLGEADIAIPALLAAHPANGLLYASRFVQGPGNIPQLIGVVERATMQVQNDIPVGRPIPHALAISRDGAYVYTCSLSESDIIVIDAASGDVDELISLGSSKGPVQLAVSPDNNTLFVSGQVSSEMFVIDVSDPNNRNIVATIPMNAQPWHPVFTPDGSRVYVGNLGANTVTVINASDFSTSVIGSGTGQDGIAQPHGIAMAENGQHVFVSCRNASGAYKPRHDFGDNANSGTVVVINTATNQIEKVIEVEEFASGMSL